MESTSGGELTDFCLLLPASADSVERAGEAVASRFTSLDDETRTSLAVVVMERVRSFVEGGANDLISVTLAVEPGTIRGAVSEQGAAEDEKEESRFEIPLARSAEAQQ
jgi:hypothetical protein